MSRVAMPLVITCLLGACSKETPKPAAEAPPKVAATAAAPAKPFKPWVSESEARRTFMGRCASCHGAEGKGDGPGSAALNPKPRNYTDPTWQKSVTDEQIGKTILYGGAAVGKSPNMPSNADLDSKPEMIEALVKVVRSFAPKEAAPAAPSAVPSGH